ncbi:exocyst complex component EXO70E2 [Senna tora]|uniref:Exocyst subunit Exo70 family protein n=1 Tax=Senna tora TaxID=362788 RepID=A0A834SGC1_9FABA|nr:exocyst complex component EXO70E2 [Senna tora]
MAVEESNHVIAELEREENLIAAAKHIVKALGSNRNLTNDAKKILADLGTQLSSMTEFGQKGEGNEWQNGEEDAEGDSAIEGRLNNIEEKIVRWEADHESWIWDSAPDEVSEYLAAADEARLLVEKLEGLDLKREDEEYKSLLRAHSVLQIAMARLEEEFMNLLIQYGQPSEPAEFVSFRSVEEDAVDEGFRVSLDDDSVEESLQQRESVNRGSEENLIDLVHPDVIPTLRSIAHQMFDSRYDRECSHAYVIARRDALDECLLILKMERLSIEDVLRMQWGPLNSKIKRWIWAVKIFVRVYLASERWLSEQIFGEGEPVSLVCFVDASKVSIFQLLNLCEAMSIGPHQPEKLFRILDMYEALAELMPDIDALYTDEVGSSVRTEFHEALMRLGDCVRATFLEFGNAIASNASSTPFVGGGIHPLTRYVMNYLRTLIDYNETLNLLLKNQEEDDAVLLSSPDLSPDNEENSKVPGSPNRVSSTTLHFRLVASILLSNLDDKSKLYKEAALQHLFLMNNIHYMAQKVKGSELRLIYGDEWIRKHNWKFQQHAMNYERASWSSILSLLKDDGFQIPGTNSVLKTSLKESLQRFYLAFEDLYRSQTAWLIPDVQLREDLRISISLKVIHAYRTFVGRHSYHISDKHIKWKTTIKHLIDPGERSSRKSMSQYEVVSLWNANGLNCFLILKWLRPPPMNIHLSCPYELSAHTKQLIAFYELCAQTKWHLTLCFDNWELFHIYREANFVADSLANLGRLSRSPLMTFLSPPDCSVDHLLHDSSFGKFRCTK